MRCRSTPAGRAISFQAGGAAAINGGAAVQVSVGSGVVVGLNTFKILTANGGVSGQFHVDQQRSVRH